MPTLSLMPRTDTRCRTQPRAQGTTRGVEVNRRAAGEVLVWVATQQSGDVKPDVERQSSCTFRVASSLP